MARRRTIRSEMYKGARLLGNIQAAEAGPLSYGKRVVRRKVYAKTNGKLSKTLRSFGL
jgi:hypothetical protein